MKKLLVALAALMIAAPLGGCQDLGDCLAEHTEFQPGYTYYTSMSFDGGKTSQVIPQYVPDSYVSVCDQWEFPEGRPDVEEVPEEAVADVSGIVGQM